MISTTRTVMLDVDESSAICPLPPRRELRSEVELLREAQDRLHNVMKLQGVLGHHGLEVLGYEGPAPYGPNGIVQCELCGDLLDVTDVRFVLSLQSMTYGRHHGYAHRDCFERATEAP
ncbi:MAG: hypothetical protein SA339_13100 [Methanomassiliicoccus sp.]|nr:hypothetical protein [Methanomassiliicoccus sp.]